MVLFVYLLWLYLEAYHKYMRFVSLACILVRRCPGSILLGLLNVQKGKGVIKSCPFVDFSLYYSISQYQSYGHPDAITYLTVDNTVYVIFQFGCDRRKMLLISISEKFAESVLEFRV